MRSTCPGSPGTNFERFRAKAEAYLREHLDNLVLQRLRRNKQLTPDDLAELEQLLVALGGQQADLAWADAKNGGLGITLDGVVRTISKHVIPGDVSYARPICTGCMGW